MSRLPRATVLLLVVVFAATALAVYNSCGILTDFETSSLCVAACQPTQNTTWAPVPDGEADYNSFYAWTRAVLANVTPPLYNDSVTVADRWVNTSTADPNIYFLPGSTGCYINVSFVFEVAQFRNRMGYFTFPLAGGPDSSNIQLFSEVAVDCRTDNPTQSCLPPGATVTRLGPFDSTVGVGFYIVPDGICRTIPLLYTRDSRNSIQPTWNSIPQAHGRVVAIFKDPNTRRVMHAWEDNPDYDEDYNDNVFSITSSCPLDETKIPCYEECRDVTHVLDLAACVCSSPSPSPSPSLSPLPSPSPSNSPQPLLLYSNASANAEMPQLVLNRTAPALSIVPKDTAGVLREGSAVGVILGSVREMDESNSTTSTVRRSAAITNGAWRAVGPDPVLGSSQSFVFAARLATVVDGGNLDNSSSLELQLDLFDNATYISLDGVVNFTVLPAFTKLSLRVWNWPWVSSSSAAYHHRRLEVRLAIAPQVTDVISSSGGNGVTELKMSTKRTANDVGEVVKIRLVNAATIDGRVVQTVDHGDGGPVDAARFSIDEAQSALVLSFAYFNTTLAYDPDLGVLMGSRREYGDDSGSSSIGWIIAVAVAVPVALLVVVLVVGGALVFWRVRGRGNIARRGTVNFDSQDKSL